MKKNITYLADDGTTFDSMEKCLEYEETLNEMDKIISALKQTKKICENSKDCDCCPIHKAFNMCPMCPISYDILPSEWNFLI